MLTEEQKLVYEAMANDFEERGKGALHNKFTSDGRSIISVLQQEDGRTQQRRHMINSIHRYVDDIGTVDEIKRWPFYILTFNMLCEANGIYYPVQIGPIEYSIEQGFIGAFHKFIDPGPIPLVFASSAKDHSEATNGIPITGFEEGTTDCRSVVRDLMAYFRLPIDDASLLPLFCLQDHISQAACVLAACCGLKNMGDGDKDRLALNMFCYQEEDTAGVVFRPKPASHTPQATALMRGHWWRRRLSCWAPSSKDTRSSEMALTTSTIVPLLSKQMPYSLPAKRYVWSYLLSEDGVWGAFGCHPHMANEYNMDVEEDLVHALDRPSVVALGEIGLDYLYKYHGHQPIYVQGKINACPIDLQ